MDAADFHRGQELRFDLQASPTRHRVAELHHWRLISFRIFRRFEGTSGPPKFGSYGPRPHLKDILGSVPL